MGNSNSKKLTIVKTPFDLPEDIKTQYINKLSRYVSYKLTINQWLFELYDTDCITVNGTTYQIDSIIGVIPEVIQNFQIKSLWTCSINYDRRYGHTIIFRRVLNTEWLMDRDGIPTHIANQTMRTAIEKEEQCSITFAPLNEETVVLTSCGHLFSKEGLTTWFQTRSVMEHNCPTCSKHVQKVHSLSLYSE
jgi:hypothetical protein